MTLEALKAAGASHELFSHPAVQTAGSGVIAQIIALIQKYGPIADQLIKDVLPLVSGSVTLTTILTALEQLLKIISPSA